MRSGRQSAEVVNRVVDEIRCVLKAYQLAHMNNYNWFDKEAFKDGGFDKLIKDTCARYGISERHIRSVGGWRKAKIGKKTTKIDWT